MFQRGDFLGNWNLDIRQWAEEKKIAIGNAKKNFVFALYSEIVKKTPVDTGRARGNWNISKGSVDPKTSDSQLTPQYSATSQIPNCEGDEPYYISNNLDYITKLEYGGFPNPPKKSSGKTVNGFSKQAPNGMVGVTLANARAIFNAAAESAGL